MADDDKNNNNLDGDNNNPPQDGDSNLDGLETKELVSIIKDLRSENAKRRTASKDLEDRLRKIEADKTAAEEEEAKKRGEFEDLYNKTNVELEGLKGKSEALESTIKKYLDIEIESVPEGLRGTIPDLSPEKQLEWIQEAKKAGLFGTPSAPGPGYKPPGDNTTETLEAKYEEARKAGNASLCMRLKRQIAEKNKTLQ
jgi:hypothetical protein